MILRWLLVERFFLSSFTLRFFLSVRAVVPFDFRADVFPVTKLEHVRDVNEFIVYSVINSAILPRRIDQSDDNEAPVRLLLSPGFFAIESSSR